MELLQSKISSIQFEFNPSFWVDISIRRISAIAAESTEVRGVHVVEAWVVVRVQPPEVRRPHHGVELLPLRRVLQVTSRRAIGKF